MMTVIVTIGPLLVKRGRPAFSTPGHRKKSQSMVLHHYQNRRFSPDSRLELRLQESKLLRNHRQDLELDG